MASDENHPTVSLTVGSIGSLADVARWAAVAEFLGFPASSGVAVTGHTAALTVTAYLAQLPDLAEHQ